MLISVGLNVHPKWTRVDDDFILGACAHRLFGYISQSPTGGWAVFDSDAQPVGSFTALPAAQEALWASHQLAHDAHRAPKRSMWRSRRGGRVPCEATLTPGTPTQADRRGYRGAELVWAHLAAGRSRSHDDS